MHRNKSTLSRFMDENVEQNAAGDRKQGQALDNIIRPLGERKQNVLEKPIKAENKVESETEQKAHERAGSTLRYGGHQFLIPVDNAEDIDNYMRYLELKHPIPEKFLHGHPHIDGRMRQILVDWLIHVQCRFSMLTETLSLAVHALDRSLMAMPWVSKNNLQLLGVSCLFSASKFEEIIVPNIEDYVQVAANVFSKDQIFEMEQKVLRALNFEFGQPHSIQFLRRYRFFTSPNKQTYELAKYICEVAMVSYSLVHLLPSTVAAVAIYLASGVFAHPISRSSCAQIFKIEKSHLENIARSFVDPIIKFADSNERLYALREKYDSTVLSLLTSTELGRLRDFEDFGAF